MMKRHFKPWVLPFAASTMMALVRQVIDICKNTATWNLPDLSEADLN